MVNARVFDFLSSAPLFGPANYQFTIGGASPDSFYSFSVSTIDSYKVSVKQFGWSPLVGPIIELSIESNGLVEVKLTVLEASPVQVTGAMRKAPLTLNPVTKP